MSLISAFRRLTVSRSAMAIAGGLEGSVPMNFEGTIEELETWSLIDFLGTKTIEFPSQELLNGLHCEEASCDALTMTASDVMRYWRQLSGVLPNSLLQRKKSSFSLQALSLN